MHSQPVLVPHHCCELSLWQCLDKARAPTESLACGQCCLVKAPKRVVRGGGRTAQLLAVHLKPSKSRTPLRLSSWNGIHGFTGARICVAFFTHFEYF